MPLTLTRSRFTLEQHVKVSWQQGPKKQQMCVFDDVTGMMQTKCITSVAVDKTALPYHSSTLSLTQVLTSLASV